MSENTTAPPALELREVHLAYRGPRGEALPAVHGIDLTIGRGEFVALVGESGSGKSSTAAAITGLLPPGAGITEGEILLSGVPVRGLGERRWSRLRGRAVGLIPQDPGGSLNPVLTIGAQLAEVFRVRGERLSRSETRARSIQLLETAEVSRPADRLHQYPHELSGGLKQRILIAIAFGLNPTLIVADEPTSALDVTVQRQVLAVFDRLASEHGTSVLFVTHDIALATDHADRIAVMQQGRIVEEGPVEQLVHSPREAYTWELLDHARAQGRRAPEPDANAPTVLQLQELSKTFSIRGRGQRTAVSEISLEITRGQTLALVGESGSGKSTTARMALRLTDPDSGRILLHGDEVTGLRGAARAKLWREVQLVYQNPDSALNPRWTVRDIVAEPLRGRLPRREIAQRVDSLLTAVALPAETATRRPAELSGGQRQRVAIARAIAPDSSVVVLDEALSALDVITQEHVIELLLRLQQELGVAYLFISHDLAVVRRLAHHVVVLQDGNVVEQGATEQLFASPQTDYVRELMASIPGTRHLHSDPH